MINSGKNHEGSLIWITGYSSSGKTTIATELVQELRTKGNVVVHLDGDELRQIFGNKWGHSRTEKIELAAVYMRLCRTLVEQGQLVVLSAVAMFPEIYEWVAQSIPSSLIVLVEAPLHTRVLRDSATKNVYPDINVQGQIYELPTNIDLRIENFDGASISGFVHEIAKIYEESKHLNQDFGRTDHWIKYYGGPDLNFSESSFARLAMGHLSPGQLIVDVGCGEGRDSHFFANQGLRVIGFDVSPTAIEKCESHNPSRSNSTFVSSEFDLSQLKVEIVPDIIYSRFSLHAMTGEEGDRFLTRSYAALPVGGLMFIECRSLNDPLAQKGEVLSETERMYGHYRRFIKIEDLIFFAEKLGFSVRSATEVQGVSKAGSDDPVLIRAILEK